MKMTPFSGTAPLCLGWHVDIKERRSFKVGISFNKTTATPIHLAPAAPQEAPAAPASLSFDQALALAGSLNKDSAPAEISQVLKSVAMANFDPIARDKIINRIHNLSGVRFGVLGKELTSIELKLNGASRDKAYVLAERLLDVSFKGGAHLLRSVDGAYWMFGGSHWRTTSDAVICQLLMAEAKKFFPGCGNLQQLVANAKKTLDYMQASDHDLMGFNDDPLPVINCANGEVWLDKYGKPELRPHRPESRLAACLPITYDSAATCPIFDKTALEIFAEADEPTDMVRHSFEFLGYSLQPRRDIACFWMLIGHGANGKSKFLQTLQRLVGPAAVMNTPISKFQSDRFNLAALQGKLLLIDDDMGESTRLDDGLLKAISEAKEVSARHAYGERHFKFRCLALPVMAGNHFPTTADNSHGLRRRAMVIPFDRKFGPDEADATLFPKIWQTELPGVLNRALEGLARLRKREDFLLPTDCVRAAQEFMANANPLSPS
jgi:putative DNA primase/helicase